MTVAVVALSVVLALAIVALAFHVYLGMLQDRYPAPALADEVHTVVTEDGWTIFLHRRRPANGRGEPVFLCHGLATNHFNFMLPPGGSIGDALAEAGYDCWLADLRACRSATPAPGVSRLTATVDDLLLHDVPAALDYVVKATGYEKVHWIGHSMGGMLLYAYELRFGNGRLASAVTLGAPIGFAGTRHKSHSFLVAIAPYVHRYMANAFRALSPLISGRAISVRWLPINWENTDARIGAAAIFHAMELPLPRIGGQMDAWAASQTWTMCGGELDVPARLHELQTPLLAVFARSDPFIPQSRARAFFEALPNPDKKMLVLSKENGHSADYNHIDLAVSTNNAEEVQQPIVDWLRAHPIRVDAAESGGRQPGRKAAKAAPRKRVAAAKKPAAEPRVPRGQGKARPKPAIRAKTKPKPKPKAKAKAKAKTGGKRL